MRTFSAFFFGQSSPLSKNNSRGSKRGTEQPAESVPTTTPLSLARFCLSCSHVHKAYLVRRPPELLSFGQWGPVALFLLMLVLCDFIVRCRGLCQGLHWVTSPISDFLLCVIRLSQTLNCHWQIRGGGTRGETRGCPNLNQRGVEAALMLKSFNVI